MKPVFTQNQLKELLKYNPCTGEFRRLVKTCNSVNIGDIAGGKNNDGYIVIGVMGKQYYGHQLAFLYMLGYVPSNIDHLDRRRSNNQWNNLREVIKAQNNRNRAPNKSTTSSKYKGVSLNPPSKKFRAKIKLNKQVFHLGYFDTAEAAAHAYDEKALELFGEYAYVNFPT